MTSTPGTNNSILFVCICKELLYQLNAKQLNYLLFVLYAREGCVPCVASQYIAHIKELYR